jgi:hypothetical protein
MSKQDRNGKSEGVRGFRAMEKSFEQKHTKIAKATAYQLRLRSRA